MSLGSSHKMAKSTCKSHEQSSEQRDRYVPEAPRMAIAEGRQEGPSYGTASIQPHYSWSRNHESVMNRSAGSQPFSVGHSRSTRYRSTKSRISMYRSRQLKAYLSVGRFQRHRLSPQMSSHNATPASTTNSHFMANGIGCSTSNRELYGQGHHG